MKKAELELYTDYLISTFGSATATGLSAMVDGDVSHVRIRIDAAINSHDDLATRISNTSSIYTTLTFGHI